MNGPEIVDRIATYGDRTAVRAADGVFSYRQLLDDSQRAASALAGGGRIAFLVQPSYRYVVTMIGAWRAGGMAVPIGTALADPEIEHTLDDAAPAVAVADDAYAARLEPLARAARGVRFTHVDELLGYGAHAGPDVEESRASLMVYTSGTTGRPKGVVHTHASVAAQIRGMVDAWQWSSDDRILCTLPLHHVHGIVNVVCCALWSGARCDIMPSFDADEVWRRIGADDLTLFMAVPTIYVRLIQAYDSADPATQAAWARASRALRLMVSGSAALPVSTLERWRAITGQTLLERYGMTELGMVLGNPLSDRRPGHVGVPFPGVEVELADDGELLVRGANVFREYWNRPDATREAFLDGWFRTGDVAVVDDGSYRILGRASIDIIKSGGEKISALEVEDVLREHPLIDDCAVVGVPDDEWGERVCAAVALVGSREELGDLRAWAKERLAAYKVPRQIVIVDELPRNAMGKVIKPDLVTQFTRA